MAGEIVIRPIGEDERAAWNPLWAGYLAFYKSTLTQEISDLTWDRFHDPEEQIFALGGYIDGELMGIAHYLFHRSTWALHRYCYLEDLFVAEAARVLARVPRAPRVPHGRGGWIPQHHGQYLVGHCAGRPISSE